MRAAFRHGHPGMAGYEIPQVAAWAELNRVRAVEHIRHLDAALAGHRFVTGDSYTIADITALIAVDFMRLPKIQVPEDCVNVKRWHAEVSARPSAGA